MNNELFNNYNLTNEEIESIINQMDSFINNNCYVNG